jgi:hypothetical protein
MTGLHEFITLALIVPLIFSPLLILASWFMRAIIWRFQTL